MMPVFRDIVRAQQNAKQLSADIRGVVEGSLTIGCYYSVSAMWMPDILVAARRSSYDMIKSGGAVHPLNFCDDLTGCYVSISQ